jgi:4-hydroxymandelate oxidase
MRTLVPAGGDPAGALPAGWGVRRAARLAFPGPAALAADPRHAERLRVYLTDMLAPYGLALDAPAAGDGDGDGEGDGGRSYGEMAEELIRAVVPPGEQVDLLVLAYRVPDITPGRATATWLSHVCPGRPLAFAVSDPSPAAAFTALRLTRAYAAGAGLARALLLVVEQPSLPYAPALPHALPDAAYGVALLLGPPLPGEHPPAAPARGPADLAAALAGAPGAVTLLLGPSVPPPAGGARVRRAAAHRPTTGVWWELAGALTPSADPHRLVLADAAEGAAGPAVAAFDVSAAPVAAAARAAGGPR